MANQVKLSVIIPVYNEENTVDQIVKMLIKMKEVWEIVAVDDGSTDATLEVLKSFKSKKLKVLTKPNGGKGSAIRYALPHVRGTHILIQDADLEYDPEENIPNLLSPIKKGKVQVVYGSRFLGSRLNLLFWHMLGNQFLNLVTNILYNTTMSDLETCYKLLPTNMMRNLHLRANHFDIEPEITCKLLRAGVKIYEVPITYVGRDYSQGKKITWRDGFAALRVIFAIRLLPF